MAGPGCGACAGSSTRSAAAWACAAAAATPPASSPETPWTSGASSRSSRTGCYGWPPRCAGRGGVGCSSNWPRWKTGDAPRANRPVGPGGPGRQTLLVLAVAPAPVDLPLDDPWHRQGGRLHVGRLGVGPRRRPAVRRGAAPRLTRVSAGTTEIGRITVLHSTETGADRSAIPGSSVKGPIEEGVPHGL